MNYLAHLYLSGNNNELMIGNFIADHLKGKLRNTYSGEIKRGIELHHAIDSFTDSHPVVEQSKARIRPLMNKFTPVVMDVYYDHFLAINWKDFHDDELKNFAHHVYLILEKNHELLPDRTKNMLVYMKQQNWLVGYADLNHLHNIFSNMSRRTKYENNMQQSVELLKQDYDLFKNEFEIFFSELKSMSTDFLLK